MHLHENPPLVTVVEPQDKAWQTMVESHWYKHGLPVLPQDRVLGLYAYTHYKQGTHFLSNIWQEEINAYFKHNVIDHIP